MVSNSGSQSITIHRVLWETITGGNPAVELVQVIENLTWNLFSPKELAVDRTGNIFVTDSEASCVRVYSSFEEGFKSIRSLKASPPFKPDLITLDSEDNVLVTDVVNECVRIISPEGRGVGKFSIEGTPTGIQVDPYSGLIYVADARKRCVTVF